MSNATITTEATHADDTYGRQLYLTAQQLLTVRHQHEQHVNTRDVVFTILCFVVQIAC